MGNVLKKSKLIRSSSSKPSSSTSSSSKPSSSKSSSSKSSSSKSSSSISSSSKSFSSKSSSSKSFSSKNKENLFEKINLKTEIKSVINYDKSEKNIIFNKYKILNVISHGYHGIVYLVEDENKNKYAYKIEKIGKNELINNYRSKLARQLDFFENICKKYQNHFMKLHDYYITNDCDFDYNYILKNSNRKNIILSYKDLPYCVHYFYSLVDITFFNYINNWKYFQNKIFNALLLQLLYIIYILHLHGYTHCDLNLGNIALKKTNNKYITILNKQIPTYGYYVQLIDYGSIEHNKYYKKNIFNNKLQIKYKTDLIHVITMISIFKHFNFSKKFKKNENANILLQIKYGFVKNISKNKLLIINEKLNELLNLNINKNYYYKYKQYLQKALFRVLFYKDFQKSISNNYIVQLNDFMNNDDIFFIIKNLYDPYKVLQYFLDKFH